jgi:hypothetical protein
MGIYLFPISNSGLCVAIINFFDDFRHQNFKSRRRGETSFHGVPKGDRPAKSAQSLVVNVECDGFHGFTFHLALAALLAASLLCEAVIFLARA